VTESGRQVAPKCHQTAPLAWQVEGPESAEVLVLLNSVGSTTALWDAQVGPLAEQFRVVRIDHRGHGRSPASPPGSPSGLADLGADLVATLDEVTDALRVRRVHVAGVSLGGMLAMWLAAHHPDRVGRIALLCTAAYLPPVEGWLDRAAAVRSGGMASIAGAVTARWLTPALAERDPDLALRLLEMLSGIDAESYAQCCEAIAGMDQRADLARIAAPTVVIAGAQDLATPPDLLQVIVDGLPGARFEVLSPAAHLAPLEAAREVTLLLTEHFGGGASMTAGYRTRRAVLGDEHVDRTVAAGTEFTAAFQQFITRYAWGDVWSRPGLSRRDRSAVTLAALVTLGAEHEIGMHVRGALRNGLTPDEIAEVLLHTALYAGLPRANRAFAVAQQVLLAP